MVVIAYGHRWRWVLGVDIFLSKRRETRRGFLSWVSNLGLLFEKNGAEHIFFPLTLHTLLLGRETKNLYTYS